MRAMARWGQYLNIDLKAHTAQSALPYWVNGSSVSFSFGMAQHNRLASLYLSSRFCRDGL